jgi:hypothetical protein
MDHLNHATFFVQHFGLVTWKERADPLLNTPPDRLEWNLKRGKNLIIESVFANEQLVHVLDPAAEYVPALHVVHVPAPDEEDVPARHVLHTLDPCVAKEPARHCWQVPLVDW